MSDSCWKQHLLSCENTRLHESTLFLAPHCETTTRNCIRRELCQNTHDECGLRTESGGKHVYNTPTEWAWALFASSFPWYVMPFYLLHTFSRTQTLVLHTIVLSDKIKVVCGWMSFAPRRPHCQRRRAQRSHLFDGECEGGRVRGYAQTRAVNRRRARMGSSRMLTQNSLLAGRPTLFVL